MIRQPTRLPLPIRSLYHRKLDAAETGLQGANAALAEGSAQLRECGNEQLEKLGGEILELRKRIRVLRDRILLELRGM